MADVSGGGLSFMASSGATTSSGCVISCSGGVDEDVADPDGGVAVSSDAGGFGVVVTSGRSRILEAGEGTDIGEDAGAAGLKAALN